MQTKPNRFPINAGAPAEGRLRVCTPRTLLEGWVSLRAFSENNTGVPCSRLVLGLALSVQGGLDV